MSELLGVDQHDPMRRVMTGVRIRPETGGVEALLLEARAGGRSVLPGGRNQADFNADATAAIDRLRLISL
ncbi:hypothetical protein [Saccharopolyspora pogona]|uniref:hypothetical protein n=1 Tax=Saccharopolyspora pogona TaxID=333966 RepID=UPI001CC2258E|nr:hypothetical protein [Saccharopolyspora pogona]